MKTKEFLHQLDQGRIEAAIREAEERTSGEIRVMISRRKAADPMAFARRQFLRLGMDRTAERNAVLIVVAPRSRTFAAAGDKAVYERCGETFWEELAGNMGASFKAGDFTAGIVHAISRVGDVLATHFPRQPRAINELPDTIIEDEPEA